MAETRRERYRKQTIDEIKTVAMTQVVSGGETAVSLNGIAKSMAMSPAALYRYFANRDDLIAELVVDAYHELADHVERAATPGNPRDRLAAVAHAYRDWALRNPNTYRLVFESTSGSGLTLATDRIAPAAQRSMDVMLGAIAEAAPNVPPVTVAPALADEITRWAERSGHTELSTSVLYFGLACWVRMHGLISLDIGSHLAATGVSGALLFDQELDQLLTAVTGPA